MRVILVFVVLLCSLKTVAGPYVPFEENGKFGLKNEAGQVVIPARYDALGWSNGTFSVSGRVTGYKLGGTWGIITVNNEQVTKPDYLSLMPADGSLIVATKKSSPVVVSAGLINTEGKVIIPFTYAGVKVHSLRIVAFIREGNKFKHGLISLENKVLIPFEYKNIYPIGSLRYAVEDFTGKIALYSEGGKQISGFTIDSLSDFKYDVAILYENGKQGLINREGQLKSEAKFRDVQITKERIRARMPDEWLVMTADNKTLDVVEGDSIAYLNEDRYKIMSGHQRWLADKNFKKIGNSVLDIEAFKNGLAIFKTSTGYGVIKKNGGVLLKPGFRKILFEGNYLLVQDGNNNWSMRDTTGLLRTSKAYDAIAKNNQGLFVVARKKYFGAIDETGREVVACVYDSILETGDDQLAVKFKGLYGIIDAREKWLVYPQPNKVMLLNKDRYFKKVSRMLFLVSFDGTVLYFTENPIRVNAENFTEYVSTGGTWTIDFDGKIVSRQLAPVETTEKVFPASEGLRGIKRQGKYGFIDDLGRLRIANRYEDIMPFSEGLAAFKIRNKWGFINRDEKIIVHPAYDDVTPFSNGHSIVKQKGLFGYMDNEGKVVLPVRYNSVEVLKTNRLVVTLNGLKGLADANGNVLLHPKYESIQDIGNGYIVVKQDGKYGLATLKGLNTIPQMYNYLMFDAENDRYLALKKAEWIELGIRD
ncbi:MAG: WG repeat-containing protein [Cyclobacteriaceae bacterium]|nr:WG repeat-containing protein [Cyclobacteriaceae bacterium]